MEKNNLLSRRQFAKIMAIGGSTFAVAPLLTSCNTSSNDTTNYVEKTKKNVQTVAEYAATMKNENDMQHRSEAGIENYSQGKFTWDNENKNRTWTYYNGVVFDGLIALDEAAYKEYVDEVYLANIKENGEIQYSPDSNTLPQELDAVEPARALFDLLATKNSTRYIAAIQNVYSMLEKQTSYPECGNCFTHKMNSSSWKEYNIALDGLYMAEPFLLECANAISSEKLKLTSSDGATISPDNLYLNTSKRFAWVYDNMYDKNTQLYNHAYSVSGTKTNGMCWSRSFGWFCMSLVDAIDLMPTDTIDRKAIRERLISYLPRVFDGLLKYQSADTGLWINVPMQNPSDEKNVDETSGSSMFAYTLLNSYSKGYVTDKKYGIAGLNAFSGVVKHQMEYDKDKSRNVVHGTYKQSGVCTSEKDYCNKYDYVDDEAKGIGALIFASIYANKVAEKLKESGVTDLTA